MTRTTKSRALYTTPFCKAYWRDAAAELKDLRMLVFAALIVALRVALKTVVRIPLAPSLDITPAFLANALGAMVYGPVVGAVCIPVASACVGFLANIPGMYGITRWNMVIVYVLMLIVILIKPQGLMGKPIVKKV